MFSIYLRGTGRLAPLRKYPCFPGHCWKRLCLVLHKHTDEALNGECDLVSRLSSLQGGMDKPFPAELQAGLENRSWEWSTSPPTALPELSCRFHAGGRKPRERTAQSRGWATWQGMSPQFHTSNEIPRICQAAMATTKPDESLKKPCHGDLPPERSLDSAVCRHWAVLSLCYGLFQDSFCCVCRFPPNSGMRYRGRLCVPALCLYWAFLGLAAEDTCFSPKYDSREAQRLHPALCSYT